MVGGEAARAAGTRRRASGVDNPSHAETETGTNGKNRQTECNNQCVTTRCRFKWRECWSMGPCIIMLSLSLGRESHFKN